jgi:hypothetical protein
MVLLKVLKDLSFSCATGSIEKIVILNVTGGTSTILSTFIVPDIFNTKTFQVTLAFNSVRFSNGLLTIQIKSM